MLVYILWRMDADHEWYDDVAFPALLRAARTAYGSAVRADLADAGCDDMPRNGSFVVAATSRSGAMAPLSGIIRDLRVSKQAGGQLVDTLVARGYLDRAVSAEDRRRLTITLTERGQAAAEVIRSAVERVDSELADRVGPGCVAQARAALAALVEMGHQASAADGGG
jgi:DNA-binding MarR family transcriptional regulator